MINERLGQLGFWSLKLHPSAPKALHEEIDYAGHIFVTRGRLDHREFSDATMKTLGIWGGVVLRKRASKQLLLSGTSLWWWLGAKEVGKMFEGAGKLSLSSASFATCISGILAAPTPITSGSVTAIAGTLTAEFDGAVQRDILDRVLDAFGGEARLQLDFTLDAGVESDIFTTTPAVTLVRQEFAGEDMNITGLAVKSLEADEDIEEYVTTAKVRANDKSVASSTLVTIPYTDPQGNDLDRTKLWSETDLEAALASARADQLRDAHGSLHRSIKIKLGDYIVLGGHFDVGDTVAVWDPTISLEDSTNQDNFRGMVIQPEHIRVVGRSWPIVKGMGVYHRKSDGTYIDLTSYAEYETGDISLTVGDLEHGSRTSGGAISTIDEDKTVPTKPTPASTPWTTELYRDEENLQRAAVTVEWTHDGLNTDGSAVNDGSQILIRWRRQGTTHYRKTAAEFDDVSYRLADLAPGKTYEIQLKAVDRTGNTDGWTTAELVTPTDTTAPGAPPQPALVLDQGQVLVSVDLSIGSYGTSNDDITHFRVYIGETATPTTLGSPGSIPVDPKQLADEVTVKRRIDVPAAVAQGGTIYVRLKAVDAAKNVSNYGTVSSISQGADPTIPAAPTGLVLTGGVYAAQGKTRGKVRVQFNAVSTNADASAIHDLAGYLVRWRIDGSGDPFQKATSEDNDFLIRNLDPNVTYQVEVKAVDNYGNKSAAVSGTAATTDTVAPTAPPAPTVAIDQGQILVEVDLSAAGWGAANLDVKNLRVYAGAATAPTALASPGSIPVTYEDLLNGATVKRRIDVPASVAQGGTVYVRLKAVDVSANVSGYGSEASVSQSADTTIPAAPTGLVLTNGVYNNARGKPRGKIRVQFDVVTTNADASAIHDLAGYIVKWRINGSGDPFEKAISDDNDFSIRRLDLNVTYQVRVLAFDNYGNNSAAVSGTDTTTDTTAPGTPNTPALAQAPGGVEVSLGLNPYGPDNTDIELFQIFGGPATAPTVQIGVLPVTYEDLTGEATISTKVLIPTDELEETYYIRAKALDYSGNLSAYSAEASRLDNRIDRVAVGPAAIVNSKLAAGAVRVGGYPSWGYGGSTAAWNAASPFPFALEHWEVDQALVMPGNNADYVDAEIINLAPADDAHCHQSIGTWVNGNLMNTIQQSTDLTPLFGDSHGEASADGGAEGRVATASGTSGIPVAASTEYTYIIHVATDTASRSTQLVIDWIDAAGASISVSSSGWTAITGSFTKVTLTATSPALAAFAALVCILDVAPAGAGSIGAGEKLYWDQVSLAAGANTTWVPSTIIVGDLDVRVRHAHREWNESTARKAYGGQWGALNRWAWTAGNTDDYMRLDYVDNGTTSRGVEISVGDILPNVTKTHRLRVVWGGTNLAYFDEDDGGGGWDNLGSGAILGSSFAPVLHLTDLYIGAFDAAPGTFAALGAYEWFEMRDGVDGPIVASTDFRDSTQWTAGGTTSTSPEGHIFTVNQGTLGDKAAIRDESFILHTGSEYLTVTHRAEIDFDGNADLSAAVGARTADVTPPARMTLISKGDTMTLPTMWGISHETGGKLLAWASDGVDYGNDQTLTGPAADTLYVGGIEREGGVEIEADLDGVKSGTPNTADGLGTLVNSTDVLIGANDADNVDNFYIGETGWAAIFRRLLTATEMTERGTWNGSLATEPSWLRQACVFYWNAADPEAQEALINRNEVLNLQGIVTGRLVAKSIRAEHLHADFILTQDIEADNWASGGGASPADLSGGPDTGASAGYYWDGSAGTFQAITAYIGDARANQFYIRINGSEVGLFYNQSQVGNLNADVDSVGIEATASGYDIELLMTSDGLIKLTGSTTVVSGNLGVGTEVPSAPLDVEGSSTTDVILAELTNSDYTGGASATFHFGVADQSAYIRAIRTANNVGLDLAFMVTKNTAGSPFTPTEAMRITEGHNVGIGTDTPAELLTLSATSSDNAKLRITADAALRGYNIWRVHSTGILTFQGDQAGYTGYQFLSDDSSVLASIQDDGKMIVPASLGVGTTGAPAYTLDVSGEARISGTVRLAGPIDWAEYKGTTHAIGITENQGISLELGRTDAGAGTNTPFIDFHTGADDDYNVRLIASGTGLGTGTLTINASTVDVTGFLKIRDNGGIDFNSVSNSLRIDSTFDQLVLNLTAVDGGNQFVIGSYQGTARDYDHAPPANPTLFIHSAVDPNTDNTQWVSLSHNQANVVLSWGKGDLLMGGRIQMEGNQIVEIADLYANDTGALIGANWAARFGTTHTTDLLVAAIKDAGGTARINVADNGDLSFIDAGGTNRYRIEDNADHVFQGSTGAEIVRFDDALFSTQVGGEIGGDLRMGTGGGNSVLNHNSAGGAGAFGEITWERAGVDTWGTGVDNTNFYIYNYGTATYAMKVVASSNAIKFGDTTGFGRVQQNAGSASLPTWAFVGDTNTGSYRISADRWGVATGGVLRLDISSSVFQYKGFTIWHSGNDGVGSGLDADKLDGNHASAFCTGYAGTSGSAANLIHATNKSRFLFSSSVKHKEKIEPLLPGDTLPDVVTADRRGSWPDKQRRSHRNVLDLTPVRGMHLGNAKHGRTEPMLMLIAEEVKEKVPEAFVENTVELDDGTIVTAAAVDWQMIAASLLAVVKEQDRRLDALEGAGRR